MLSRKWKNQRSIHGIRNEADCCVLERHFAAIIASEGFSSLSLGNLIAERVYDYYCLLRKASERTNNLF